MGSLAKIEALSPQQRSSRIGYSGVLPELRTLDQSEAISWLENNIASPVSRGWGGLLFALSADWVKLKTWMHIGKNHALAAADAVDHYLKQRAEWPIDSCPEDVLEELARLVDLYKSPRLKKIYDSARLFQNPPPMPRKMLAASKILFGGHATEIRVDGNTPLARWHSLFHSADRQHCLSISDWRTSHDDLRAALASLPIALQNDDDNLGGLSIEELDLGSDEIILVALPKEEMDELKGLVPKSFKFRSSKLRPVIRTDSKR